MAETSIEWTDWSLNPIRARDTGTNAVGHYCEKISAGCANCYASGLQRRFGMPEFPGAGKSMPANIKTFLDESKLQQILRREKPTRIFWCDMTDLFGHWVPNEWIDRCFAVMALTPQHTHQVLTKRPERMRFYFRGWTDPQCARCSDYRTSCEVAGHKKGTVADRVARTCGAMGISFGGAAEVNAAMQALPLKNVWLGVSVENQQAADERIPLLLQTPAAVRFLSVEPLLGPANLGAHGWWKCQQCGRVGTHKDEIGMGRCGCGNELDPRDEIGVDWVIVGGESGPGARECRLPWLRSIVKQCREAGVPVFVKQVGSNFHSDGEVWPEAPRHVLTSHRNGMIQNTTELSRFGNGRWRLRDRKGGAMDEWPQDVRVREFPEKA